MMSGTYVLTDTIDKAFDAIFVESYAGTDAVVRGQAPEIEFQDLQAQTPPFDEEVLDAVRRVEGVQSAAGSVMDETAIKILTPEGKAVETMGAPSLGFGIDPRQSEFNPLDLVEGRWATGPGEVVIDAATADEQDYALGDRVGIASLGPVEEFELVGLAQFGGVSSLGSATFSVFELRTGQRLLAKAGKLDAVSVAAEPGVPPEELVENLQRALTTSVQVQTGAEQAEEDAGEISGFTQFIRYFLLAFAGIALFVGAFVIFNTLSITVAQRTREFATLRSIGASRGQVLRSVVLEALVIGVISSIIGLFLGLLLAKGLSSLFTQLGLDLPQTGTVFATRTIVVSLLIGIVVTVLAGLAPAIRATRVPPIAAVREGATLPPGRLAPFAPYIAIVTIVLSLLALGYSMFVDDVPTGRRLLLIAAGVLLLFLGVALLSSRLVPPLAGVVGAPAAAVGGAAGTLARGNALRNPGRTAATAAALMIGLALVTFVAVLSQGMKSSNREAIEEQVKADYVVTSQNGFEPFVAAAGDEFDQAQGVELATDVRSDLAELAGSGRYLTGVEPETITQGYTFNWKEGSDAVLSQLGRNGAIVDDNFAEEKELAVGDSFTVVSPENKQAQLVVKAIYEPPPFYPILGSVSVSKSTFDTLYERPRNQFTFVNVPGDPTDVQETQLASLVADFPDAKVQTREDWITQQDEDFNQFLAMLYVLLALSVIVSVFGMVNTLVLSVFERTRELGMLRAVGMTRRQVRRMIRHESVITALIGAALGLPLGVFLAFLVTRALSEFDIRFEVPATQLLVFAVVAIVVGMIAAIAPARRAARLRILQALQYE